MKSIRNVLAGTLFAGGTLLTAAAGLSIANAADESAAHETTASAAPAPWCGHRGHRHGRGPRRMYRQLGLTSVQRASIKALLTAARPQMRSMHRQMRANHLRLMQLKPDDPNYAKVVAEIAQSNGALAAQRTGQAAGLRAQMYAILTPAQKTQLAALEARWASSHATGEPPP